MEFRIVLCAEVVYLRTLLCSHMFYCQPENTSQSLGRHNKHVGNIKRGGKINSTLKYFSMRKCQKRQTNYSTSTFLTETMAKENAVVLDEKCLNYSSFKNTTRPPDVESCCEYTEQAADSRQGAVLRLGGWARSSKTSRCKR